MTKRFFVGLVVAAVVVLAAFSGGAPAAPGEGGPPCTDISGNTVNFPSSTDGTYTLVMQVKLGAPACIGRITYKLFVVNEASTPENPLPDYEATLTGFTADGNPVFQFSSSDSTICVYATTSSKTGHLHDRAPNATSSPNCLELTAGISGGGSGFE